MRKSLLIIALACTMAVPAAWAAPVSDTETYTLDTCPVTGQKLGSMGDPVVREIAGREVRFCCAGCVGKYEADTAAYEAKVDEAIAARQRDSYPLDTCVVSGEKLDSMGGPVDHVHGNRLVQFCCAGCEGKFEADPAKFIAQLDEAVVEQQRAGYPLDTCVVMPEEPLGEDAKDVVMANRLVRLCCKGCIDDLREDPGKYLGDLDKAAGESAG